MKLIFIKILLTAEMEVYQRNFFHVKKAHGFMEMPPKVQNISQLENVPCRNQRFFLRVIHVTRRERGKEKVKVKG